MAEPLILYFDIETSPCLAAVFQTGNQYINEASIIEHSKIISISYMFSGDKGAKTLTWDRRKNDKSMLKKFSKLIEKADVIIGHNGKRFDWTTVNARTAYHNLPPLPIIFIEDTLKQAQRSFRLPSHRLNYLCRYFGLGEKEEVGDIRTWIDITWKNDKKQLERMCHYNRKDVVLLKELYERIRPYVQGTLNKSVFKGDPECCTQCGKKDLIKRGYLYTKVGKYQIFRCKNCGKYMTSGKNLIKNSSSFKR